jgi:hypothetical protein
MEEKSINIDDYFQIVDNKNEIVNVSALMKTTSDLVSNKITLQTLFKSFE